MSKSDLKTIGASAHSKEDREENDFYATDPRALEIFLEESGIQLHNVWECACGEGHLSEVLKKRGILGKSSDLIDRGYGEVLSNFYDHSKWAGDILTNPPYGNAMEFCEHALKCIDNGRKVIMLMRIQFLESKKRKSFLMENPPKYVWVSSSRLVLAKNADFVRYSTASANCYAWFVWEKGYKGDTIVKWFN